MITETKAEKEYQAEWDARTLSEAEQIKQGKVRLERATTAAKRLVEERSKEDKALRKIAGKKSQPVKPEPYQIPNLSILSVGITGVPKSLGSPGKNGTGVTKII